MLKYIISIPLIAIAIVLIGIKGIEKSEKAECLEWSDEAQEYPNYYLTEWQKAQCNHYGIEINIPISQFNLLDRFHEKQVEQDANRNTK